MRRRHRTFDERKIIWTSDRRARRLEEMRDLDFAGDLQQFILAIKKAELATIA
jgi:hypothetical protein